MLQSSFTAGQIINLGISFILLILLLYSFPRHKQKEAWLYFLLFAFSLSLNLFSITLDSFLNTWDERYHILVAKNSLSSPLFPRLYNEKIVSINYLEDWGQSYVWLHKQPFFIWLMSLSHGVFGGSEWCYRMPDAVLVGLVTLVYYRLGSLLFNKESGLVAALLAATCYYLHRLMSGIEGMDHNDVIFYSLVTFSMWAWVEWINKPSLRFSILVGIFSGLVVLTKWLSGLWVLEGFFLYLILSKSFGKYWRHLAVSFLVCLLTFLPWQVYTYIRWPDEYLSQLTFASRHFTDVIEGHQGSWFYYFDNWPKLYGRITSLFIMPALLFGFINLKDKALSLAGTLMLLTLYAFFMIAQTKLAAFVFPASVFIYLSLGFLIYEALRRIFRSRITYVFSVLIIVFTILNFRLYKVELEHTFAEPNRYIQILTSNKLLFQKMKKELPANTVLFNIRDYSIDAMFYSDFIAYYFFPSISQLKETVGKNKIPVIVVDADYQVPDSLKQIPGLKFYHGHVEQW